MAIGEQSRVCPGLLQGAFAKLSCEYGVSLDVGEARREPVRLLRVSCR
jgi:hypothetical protein